jgi:hypothetical protein
MPMRVDQYNMWWPGLADQFGENYTHETFKSIREKGNIKWLCSLPMFEYAYTLVVDTAYRCGGKYEKYVDDLFTQRMLPILNQYHSKLMHYRFRRAILEQKWASMRNTVKDTDVMKEYRELRVYALKTRKALRGVVDDFIAEKITHTRATPKPVEETLQETYGSC